MFDKKCLHEVKSCLDRVADKTMQRLLGNDPKYQALSQEFSEVQLAYYKLDLPERSKILIKKYLSLNASMSVESVSLSYLAGILDSHMFLDIIMPDSKQCTDREQALTDFIKGMEKDEANQEDSILEQLYNGQLYPNEQICPKMPEYKELQQNLDVAKKYFEIELTQDDFERFEEFEQMLFRLFQLECYEHFTYGFKMGARMMAEAFGNRHQEPSCFGPTWGC